jgi:hypothetical protein
VRTIRRPPLLIEDDDPRLNFYFLAKVHGITRASIAREAGVFDSAVGHIMSGKIPPTDKNIRRGAVVAFAKAGHPYSEEVLFGRKSVR